MADPVVIVGGGQAAVQLCLSLRKSKYDGPIVMYSAEPELPYHRPPLSKGYLLGKTDDDKLPMRPDTFYVAKAIDLKLGVEVTSIDLAAKTVMAGTAQQSYSHLVYATGASARQLPVEGADLGGVHCLRSLAHSRAIKADLEQTDSLVVIGAGFIGLEVAAAARSLGKKVTVFDTADRVMARAVAPDISRWFEQMHADMGVEIRLSEAIDSIGGADGRVSHVNCTNGEQLAAQMVVIGIGVTPEMAVAEAAGLACDNGVLVDEYCRSSDPFVYAAGDCASHPNRYASRDRIRLESIQNATDQARVIAANIVAGETGQTAELTPYTAVPWFWSDQGDHSLQMTGLSFDAEQFVVRGDPASGSFSVYHYRAGNLLAVDSVNMPRDHMLARKLIEAGVSPDASQAADPDFDLKALLPAK
jgi:3-phenylpropionate/trans-cinnamate dioxygenase ferredoxin reductase subunit